MKKIAAILRPNKFEKIKETLASEGFTQMTLSKVLGYGRQKGQTYYYRGEKAVIKFRPKVKLELIVNDEKVNKVTEIIMKVCNTGLLGDGKIFIYPVTEVVLPEKNEMTRERAI
ncbi:P-II family nitrogen regulator [Desulfitobacterium sp. AusDCA]|uniref:P-II family nitrogen regulator n=1 Tax=Desulfitobacterium sp. AusDCA TaxID=3240383 RepID=UPI003DA70A5A